MKDTFWLALALVCLIEGIVPLLFPNKWQVYVKRMASLPVATVRSFGFSLCIIALCLFWLNG